jgi:colicin import membrane protein
MEENRKGKSIAITGTLVFHGLLLAFLLLWVIRTPIPPYPDSGSPGLEVNFGISEDGMGELQPDVSGTGEQSSMEEEVMANPEPVSRVNAVSQRIITQESEDAPAVENPKEQPKQTSVTESNTNTEAPKEKPREVNARAIYGGKKGGKQGGSEGETGKPGDQGDPNGSRDSKYHGPGGGKGDTYGDGNGDKGKGISYSLRGRKPQSLPVPKSNLQEEGMVVVEITVDPDGRVIAAKPGVKGSTTTNPALLEIARKAAMSARFSASSDSPEEQKGTITYNFILR